MLNRLPKVWLAAVFCVIAASVCSIVYAPCYLTYSDTPAASDVIVLFDFPDLQPRLHESFDLLQGGYAKYLIMPAHNKVFNANILTMKIYIKHGISPELRDLYPSYYERTHIEVLEAKKIVDRAGFKSILFVSSPYHMRRIRHMVGSVFQKENYKLYFIPTKYEKMYDGFWIFDASSAHWILSEYMKMVWFFIYHPVSRP